MTKEDLKALRSWADAKIAAGQEPAWAWYQYMKLRESLDAIIAQFECEAIVGESGGAAYLQCERGPRLVVDNNHREPVYANGALHGDRPAFRLSGR
jgi:hypothetical protein